MTLRVGHSNTLELPLESVQRVRRNAVAAAELCLAHRDQISYTQQTPGRWDGISNRRRSYRGEFPRSGDCSGFSSWLHWDATHFLAPGDKQVPDYISDGNWLWGNTATQIQHGTPVEHLKDLHILDLVFYGYDWDGKPKHVATYIGHGLVVSHGSNPGPFKLPVLYRDDFRAARRYISAS